MKSPYIKVTTVIALVAILLLQGIWLHNTYLILDKELKSNLEIEFARSIEKEIYLRFDNNASKLKEGSIVDGARPDEDFYSNALAFNEFLLLYHIPLSLECLDSIWSQKVEESTGKINYTLFITDSLENITQQINKGLKKQAILNVHLKKPIRKNQSEFVHVIIESPHKIVWSKMLLLLITSLIIAIIIGYCFYLQIKIILRKERIAEIRQDFTHAMIHDMKNPITTILMSTNVLKGGKLDNKTELKNEYFDIILKEGEHLLSLSNKILTIAQFEENKISLTKSLIDVKDLLSKLMNYYKLAATKKVEFITELHKTSTIYADQEYIYEVFSNLIDNAIKYGKESVTIYIKCTKDSNNTTIKIRDNGIGIDQNDQKRIFKKFERVHSKKEKKTSGFGLGLNYVYLVVKAHDGEIKVESIPDSYSEFTIILPNRKDGQTTTD